MIHCLRTKLRQAAFVALATLSLFTSDPGPASPTQLPIVFHHGVLGFRELGPIKYFHDIPEKIQSLGFRVYVSEVPPIGTIALRARALARQVDQILAESGQGKLHIIAHSMGGLDSRYLISSLGYGDRIASLTTIGTPHRGTIVADKVLKFLRRHGNVPTFARSLFKPDVDIEKVEATLENLSDSWINRVFNPANPNDARVHYQSWAGSTSISGRTGDRVTPILAITYRILKDIAGSNDGIVPVASASWGDFRGVLPADHFDEVGPLGGTLSKRFDYLKFYRTVCENLSP